MIVDDLFESPQTCPECGGPAFSDLLLAEKKDACYNKVRSRYKVWPSAYASGALVQCRKKGAANWGNKSKNEGVAEAFDAPYKVKWDKDKGEAHYVDVTLPDGSQLDIRFMRDDGVTSNPDEWTVEFYRNDSQDLTGQGDAQRIFATVLKAIEKFIKIEKPKEIAFAASKITDAGSKNQSRTNLYNRLIQRYALGWGYDVKISNLKGTTGYKLFRRSEQQGVAEGAGNVGSAIKSLYQKIYNAGDDEIEFFYNDSPIFAEYWDEYEGDLDSIIAEVDPEELQIIHDELESYAQQVGLAEADYSPMAKDSMKADKIRSLKNLIAIAREQGRQLRVQELELELKKLQGVAEEQLDEKCWDTHKQVGMKNKGGKMVPNCVPKEGVEETQREKIGGRYDADEFDAMVGRLKKLAGAGPMKTVWDPVKRVYKNVPVAQQPQDKK